MSVTLVTGGAGFIGSNFVRNRLRDAPEQRLVILDALTYAGSRSNLESIAASDSLRFVHGDIRDRDLVESLLIEEHIDTIVNFAAETHVDRSIDAPGQFIETNVVGTHVLLMAARQVWQLSSLQKPHRFHQVSTDEVFGSLESAAEPFVENSPYRPSSPYSASKAAADHLVQAYARTYGLQTTISRCSNNYGPFQAPDKLIPLVIVNLLTGKQIPVFGSGRNIRDWLHVDDHCRGIEHILKFGQAGETYNIGGRCERTNLEVIHALADVISGLVATSDALAQEFPDCPAARGESCEALIEYVADRPGHDWRYAIDPGKLESQLGFALIHTLGAGLPKTVDWFIQNRSWWRRGMESGQWTGVVG